VLSSALVDKVNYREPPANLGANMNRALGLGRDTGARFLLFTQDDWVLTDKLDLEPYCRLLGFLTEVALVRFSWGEGPGQTVFLPQTEGQGPGVVVTRAVDPEKSHYFYGDQPQLRRATFPDEYGWFVEGGDMGQPEVELGARLRREGFLVAASHKIFFEHCGEKSSVTEAQRFGHGM